ncbi:hypothetical protein C7959_13020 [Orenia marismortui]|uniref:Uncharacterized protein n=2 Tax=Orenia marismortui TaxID=46469 RepID=A0A4R8H1L5_9FIRM|nr:hypothetical protein C7959_13020 [Orenia marismortui]
MTAKKIKVEEKRITRKTRKMTGVLIGWYFSGELDFIIKELEEDNRGKSKSKDIVINLGKGGGLAKDLFSSTGLFNPEADQLKKMTQAKIGLDRFFRRLSFKKDGTIDKKILEKFYGEGKTGSKTAIELNLAESTIHNKKRETLDSVVKYLRAI